MFIISFAIKAGPDLIRKLVKATRHDGNPSMDGWMLEMWFFASLYYDGVKLFDENDNEVQTWPASNSKLWISMLFLLYQKIMVFGSSQTNGTKEDLMLFSWIKEKGWLDSFK
ncbi:hypothetical protein QVD99_006410 [Batrachochytrium dendrobatidis]|nr:hypothetical protein QVD99_006410 [Batrachochytrium dendrobatidis]